MGKKAQGKALFWFILVWMIASLACSNPVQTYFSSQADLRDTATASLFTLSATETNTRRPIRTGTPSVTPTQMRTKTHTLAPSDTDSILETMAEGSGTAPAKRTQTGRGNIQPNRFVETAGLTKFSYVPPAGWVKEPASGNNLTSWNLPSPQKNTACTLVFSIAKSNTTAADYAADLIDGLSNTKGVQIVWQSKFGNDAGLDAFKIIVILTDQKPDVQIAIYLFQNRGYLIMGAYGRVKDLYKEQDPAVDASLRTLRYE
jgi:hypothetical protein